MDKSTYEVEAVTEQNHWWFVGRRALFSREIRAMDLKTQPRILDAGTSTGTNLRLLRDMGFSNYEGVDLSPEAVRFCTQKELGDVCLGDLCNLPYPDESFDLILATDILEHIDDDVCAMKELCRVLKKGGKALISVPAFPSLWGLQDDVSHHKRRYGWQEFHDRLLEAGLQLDHSYFFNFILFAPIWIARQLIRLLDIQLQSENEVGGTVQNAILKKVFAWDCKIAPKLKPPFGVSILAVVAKP